MDGGAEVREQVLYQPVVHALPEEWRQAEVELLEQDYHEFLARMEAEEEEQSWQQTM